MASTNQSPAYQKAQGRFLNASTDEERIEALEEMIRECPKHKSSENMLANLKTRYKKLKSKIEKGKKSGKGSRKGIKKEDMQAVILGLTNSGKSTLISQLTNTNPKISPYDFTTQYPIVGMMPFHGTQIQLVEVPAILSDYYDRGLAHTADTALILLNSLEDLKKIEEPLKKVIGKKIIVYNVKDKSDVRKINATLKSKKYNYIIVNLDNNKEWEDGVEVVGRDLLDLLKEKIFQSFDNIRVFTKEPGKPKSPKPIILKPNSTVEDVAEKILKGFSSHVKETKIWGPSSKFGAQKVGLKHKLKDLDVVEFKTR